MSAGPQSLFLRRMPAAKKRSATVPLLPFLVLSLILPTIIVIGNCTLGALTPITDGTVDEMSMLDTAWRLVQEQYLGIDFHDPRGFGFYQVAAMLWRLLGPHHYLLWASAASFALVIIWCGCVVAVRQLRAAVGLAALFCITVAFVASGPPIYGYTSIFGFAMGYDRLMLAALLVLFVHSFGNQSNLTGERRYIDHFLAAFLLNILFLLKISGLFVGVATVTAGLILRGPFWRSVARLSVVLLFLAIMVVIDFSVAGTSVYPVIHEYRLAAQGRLGVVSGLDIALSASNLRILAVVGSMVLYVASRPSLGENRQAWRICLYIIVFYWVCQVVLNMSNASPPGVIYLAPAAAVAVVTWADMPDLASSWNRLWRKFLPRGLNELSGSQLLPLTVIAMVCVPEALASARAVHINYLVSSGNIETITVSANKGVEFNIRKDSYDGSLGPYLNRAIHGIEDLGATRDTIVNLDNENPFPTLFLAPDPKGVWVWWDFKYRNVPVGYRPGLQEVIGDACIVTEPKHSPTEPVKYYSEPLIKAVEPYLTMAFTVDYEDELWKIWRRRGGCGTIDTPSSYPD